MKRTLIKMKMMKRMTTSTTTKATLLLRVKWILTLVKLCPLLRVSKNFFSRGNVNKLLFCYFLLIAVWEIVWVPFLGCFSIGFDDFFFSCGTFDVEDFVVVAF
jgi:hypothetical protein